MKKFEEGDIFINRIKAYPSVKIFGYSGSFYINNGVEQSISINEFLTVIPPSEVLTTENEILLITESGDYLVIEQS